MALAIITGSGLEKTDLGPTDIRSVATPYGRVAVAQLRDTPRPIYILPRHGVDHTVPPHRINYRANIDALRRLKCGQIIATNAVGSLRSEMQPGEFVLPDQFLDFTHARAATFFDGNDERVHHVDVSAPYCERLRKVLLTRLRDFNLPVHPSATYLCTEGPRFETPAEIRMFAQWGADLVGMTGVPEVSLAREAGLCYASFCLVTNMAAGISTGPITGEEVVAATATRADDVKLLFTSLIYTLGEDAGCPCRENAGLWTEL